jgi:hypothetical protein
MSGPPYGGQYDPATLQPAPSRLAIYFCSACGRFGRAAPRYQECRGSKHSAHPPVEARQVGPEYEANLTPADDAPVYS